MATPQTHNLTVVRLGRLNYARALEVQQRAVERVRVARGGGDATNNAGVPQEFLLLVEHDPPVITVGRGGDGSNVLASADRLAALGVELHETSRGGDVTYHGPGQLVAYPILDLERHGRDVHGYLRQLEQTVIDLLAAYGLTAARDAEHTGVWLGREKICAIGVAITRWVTYHGLALNVATDLDYFGLIVPCGLRDRGVTSMEKQLQRPVPLDDVAARLSAKFVNSFGFAGMTEARPEEI